MVVGLEKEGIMSIPRNGVDSLEDSSLQTPQIVNREYHNFPLESKSEMWDGQSFSGSEFARSTERSRGSGFNRPSRPHASVDSVSFHCVQEYINMVGGSMFVGSGTVEAVPPIKFSGKRQDFPEWQDKWEEYVRLA